MKMRILVFDDDSTIRVMLRKTLELHGHEVRDYPDAISCPLYLKKECTCSKNHACGDIIITDYNMPGLTGLEFIENQQQNECRVQFYAVISGFLTKPIVDHARKLGCFVFKKPFNIRDMLTWLDDCERQIPPNRVLS